MKYYAVSDIHGFYDEFIISLKEQGFFEDTEPHKLIICGDLFDRGTQAKQLQEFVLDLMDKDEVILIRGNHEDLALDLLHHWHSRSYLQSHHYTNGTLDTVCQLTECTLKDLYYDSDSVGSKFMQTPFIQTIIPAMHDYYEIGNYIFVHGWIPCFAMSPNTPLAQYSYFENWRNAGESAWNAARWINGMEAAHYGVLEKEKTIVCGHWHCSFGHSKYEGKGAEFQRDSDFSPYYSEGIIALDACTAFSHKVNCIAFSV